MLGVLKTFFKKLSFLTLVVVLFLSFTGAGNIPVNAQSTTNVGFAACNFTQDSGVQGATLIQGCLKSVFTFAFVIALFLIAFRIGMNALEDYNPLVNGNATTDAVSTIWEITIGLVLIGGPVLFLNTVNSTLLNFDFLNLGNLTSNSSAPSTGTGSTTGSTGSTFTANPTNPNNITIGADINKTVAKTALCTISAVTCLIPF